MALNKRLFLVFDESLYFYKYCTDEKNNIYCRQVFSKNSICFSLCRMLRKLNLTISNKLLGDWKKDIKSYEVVIVSDYAYYKGIKKYIQKINKNCKVYMYFMNSLKSCSETEKNNIFKEFDLDEIFTFDFDDAIKYKCNFKATPYKRNGLLISPLRYEYDLVFIGRNKNRINFIENFYLHCTEKANINVYLKVLGETNIENIKLKKFMSYEEYLKILNTSSTILELVSNSQKGLTLRTLEALFYKKKLVTNNQFIRNYDFYSYFKDNILIIDDKKYSFDDVISFLGKPYKECTIDLNDYEFNKWIVMFNK